MDLKIYNSLSREVEEFKPIKPPHVGLYTCGPTVYDYVTIGNWRTYTLGDIIARVLKYNGYEVDYYMNITDVGHLTGDNAGDADTGEDRMEKAKKRENKTAWDVADFYAKDFQESYKKLNLTEPKKFTKATDYIAEQIDLVKKLEEQGLAYRINDGIYFDTLAYEKKGFHYGELSNLDHVKAGARVEFNPEKRNDRDFALWKFSPKDEKRDMEWESPWGVGFPGWHIECSAMSMKYLGEQFDIHVGGEDLKSTHHPNEIAQSQGATGKAPFVKYWLHGAFLQVDGGRMGKSLGNAYTLHDVEKKGFSPLDLRFFYMMAHYRSPLNFTWEALESAQTSLRKLQGSYLLFLNRKKSSIMENVSPESRKQRKEHYTKSFKESLNNDLSITFGLSYLWAIVNDIDLWDEDKTELLDNFDQILGFGLKKLKNFKVPQEIHQLAKDRDAARLAKDWKKSDELRDTLENKGYQVLDNSDGTVVTPKSF